MNRTMALTPVTKILVMVISREGGRYRNKLLVRIAKSFSR